MFIQTRNRALEMSKGATANTFEDFCLGLINEQDRLISNGQFSSNQALMAHNRSYNMNARKNPKSHNQVSHTSSPASSPASSQPSNAPSKASKKKDYETCKYCGKFHTKKFCWKQNKDLAKAKKKSNDEQVALCAFFVQPNKSSVEWIMDSGASKHMTGDASLFSTYDNNTHTSQKVSIGDGKQLSVIGSGNVNVSNGTLESVFHVKDMPINLLSVYRACQNGFKFEAWPDKYVLKDIKNNFKVVSSGPVDHNSGLYKFAGFYSTDKTPFHSYVAHADEISKLWHERLGHLHYGKMQLLSKMVVGLPPISSTKGVCEGCVLGKHHREMF